VTPAPGTATDKFNLGRFVQVQDPSFTHERAMLVVQPPNPAVFTGTLVLAPTNAQVQAFTDEIPAAGQVAVNPIPFPIPGPIPAGGTRFFADAVTPSNAVRDCAFQLGIQGVEAAGDVVNMTAIQLQLSATDAVAAPAATFVRMGLWDNAFRPPGNPAGLLFNNLAEADNFCGADTRRFHIRVRDVSARGTSSIQMDWL